MIKYSIDVLNVKSHRVHEGDNGSQRHIWLVDLWESIDAGAYCVRAVKLVVLRTRKFPNLEQLPQ